MQEANSSIPNHIQVPALLMCQKKYSIGDVYQLLRASENLEVIEHGEVNISPRVKECFVLFNNDERIILTKRKKIIRPEDIDGVLYESSPGSYEWLSHRFLDDVNEKITTLGMATYLSNITNSWKNKLNYRAEKSPVRSPEDLGLRPPQLGALFSVGAHWSLSKSPATIIMPTGTGKTETMLAITAAHQIKRLLVAVPSIALRTQISEKFETFGMLKHLGVLPHNIIYPVVGVVKRRPKSEEDLKIFRDCNVVVGVVSSLSGGTASDYHSKIAKIIDVLIVDEAHHVAAKTWSDLKSAFLKKPVIQFTATPFRNDGKLVDGTVIYNYPLKSAQKDNYFKKINFVPVHELNYDIADQTIADAAIQQLQSDIASGHPHQLMARCSSKERAEEIIELYNNKAPDLNPILIHSNIKDNDERVKKVRSGEAKIVVCVNMLGEGVDIPALKIAAIHDMHQSLAVLLQFIGRFTRNGDEKLSDASVVANIANPNISTALERLYSEDADWNILLREMSSAAAKEHAEFIHFLENSKPYKVKDEEVYGISQNSLRPTFSTLFYQCNSFRPKKFVNGLSDRYEIIRVWINEENKTLYFITRLTERVKWSNTKEEKHVEWHLFVLHHDVELGLLYVASTSKSSNFEGLAKSVGATRQIVGEDMFKSLGNIGRLVFNNLGVTKHGRRNLSFAMYTGADVKQALSETEKKGSRKSNISGYGWENGKQITIGCSYKGRVWSKAAGTIPHFLKWAHNIGEKLIDTTIDTRAVIANVLIPEYAIELPDCGVLCIDWPNEILSQSEDKVSLVVNECEYEIFITDIICIEINQDENKIEFEIITSEEHISLGRFSMNVKGEEGFDIECLSDPIPQIKIGASEGDLSAFFNDYPPLIRFIDLSELDGNILLRSEDAGTVEIPNTRFESWNWTSTDITKESIWKNSEKRTDSIQWKTAQYFIDGGYSVVYDDDDTGEAADLICFKEENDYIRLDLVHCKFSGGPQGGARVKDVVEVASQAIRSARWPGKFKELIKHIHNREKRHHDNPDRTGFLVGTSSSLTTLLRSYRFKEVRPEILIVQPGILKNNITRDQSVVLGAADAYLKQTLGINLDIICSE